MVIRVVRELARLHQLLALFVRVRHVEFLAAAAAVL
jgi:hypothetical protein